MIHGMIHGKIEQACLRVNKTCSSVNNNAYVVYVQYYIGKGPKDWIHCIIYPNTSAVHPFPISEWQDLDRYM